MYMWSYESIYHVIKNNVLQFVCSHDIYRWCTDCHTRFTCFYVRGNPKDLNPITEWLLWATSGSFADCASTMNSALCIQGSKLTFSPTCPMGRWLSFLVALTNHAIAQTFFKNTHITSVIWFRTCSWLMHNTMTLISMKVRTTRAFSLVPPQFKCLISYKIFSRWSMLLLTKAHSSLFSRYALSLDTTTTVIARLGARVWDDAVYECGTQNASITA